MQSVCSAVTIELLWAINLFACWLFITRLSTWEVQPLNWCVSMVAERCKINQSHHIIILVIDYFASVWICLGGCNVPHWSRTRSPCIGARERESLLCMQTVQKALPKTQGDHPGCSRNLMNRLFLGLCPPSWTLLLGSTGDRHCGKRPRLLDLRLLYPASINTAVTDTIV